MTQDRKVDLITNSQTLEDAMLEKYPHPYSRDKQYQIIEAEENILRLFIGLNERELIPYLVYIEPELSPEDCYEVRISSAPGGDYIRIRREGKVITDPDEIQEILRRKLLLN